MQLIELTDSDLLSLDYRATGSTGHVSGQGLAVNQMPGINDLVSIIIPVHNGAASIARCLEAAFASRYERFEVIVVNDGSDDSSAEIIKTFPCTLVQLPGHCGASRARNIGACHSHGDILFFTDADCLLNEDTVATAVTALKAAGRGVVLGGTYSAKPADDRFFSTFQSVFIHCAESRGRDYPDYIAAHAMVLHAGTFDKSGGFAEAFLPIIEDVEFSHRLRASGHRLVMDPDIQVRHLFDYSLRGSVGNGFRKSKYWTIYSIHNRDLLADSGTASWALKFDVVALFCSILAGLLLVGSGNVWWLFIMAALMIINITVNRDLLHGFYRARGMAFAFGASAYYLLVYPLVVGAGGVAGLLGYRHYVDVLESSG